MIFIGYSGKLTEMKNMIGLIRSISAIHNININRSNPSITMGSCVA